VVFQTGVLRSSSSVPSPLPSRVYCVLWWGVVRQQCTISSPFTSCGLLCTCGGELFVHECTSPPPSCSVVYYVRPGGVLLTSVPCLPTFSAGYLLVSLYEFFLRKTERWLFTLLLPFVGLRVSVCRSPHCLHQLVGCLILFRQLLLALG
jgi:hypothetical protein